MSPAATPPAKLHFHTLDVFSDQPFGGNPLAVVFGGETLAASQMQKLAREFNLSETVFVLPPTRSEALHRLRIFTPAVELPFAGHPTIGSAALLAELGLAGHVDASGERHFLLEEGIGLVPVRVRRIAGETTYAELTTAQRPELRAAPDTAVLASLLGLEPGDLGHDDERPVAASCGMAFVLVPLRSPELLAAIDFDPAAARRALAGQWAQQLYVYARGYENEIRARMFAPQLGVPEDPATGAAAAALAGALASAATVDGDFTWVIHQGLEMNRPSLLQTRAERRGGAVTGVRVGGHSLRISEGLLHIG